MSLAVLYAPILTEGAQRAYDVSKCIVSMYVKHLVLGYPAGRELRTLCLIIRPRSSTVSMNP